MQLSQAEQDNALYAAEDTPVVSSNVASTFYEWDAGLLFVRFLDGSLYEYELPQELAIDFMAADSFGKMVWSMLIRPGVPYRRIA